MKIKQPEILQKTIDLWGVEAQVFTFIEECGELLQALSKRRRKPNDEQALDNLQEEIADVFIMLTQLQMMFDSPKIQEYIDQKLEILQQRLS